MQKIINDPVHGFITIDDPLIYTLISHPYFQRLRRIKQMALAYLVYPGAVHTRLHHALGAYHLMCKVLETLKSKSVPISPEEEQAVKIAILLHDIGHGPFSHALEHSLVDVHHEDISLLIMHKLNEELNGKLSMAIQIFKNEYPKHFLHQLVSSQLDMDRLDYLARDSFFTGVSEGVIGYDRIIKMLTVSEDELVVEEKGIHSVEKFLIARRLMYWQVYLHKTVMCSEIMLVKILTRAKYLMQQGNELFATPWLHFFLSQSADLATFKKQPKVLEQFVLLDDTDIVTSIKTWCSHPDSILSALCKSILNRHLFKLKFISEPGMLPPEVDKIVSGFSPEEMLYYCKEGAAINNTYDHKHGTIKIQFKNGELKTINEVEHTIIHAELLVPVKKHYICYLDS